MVAGARHVVFALAGTHYAVEARHVRHVLPVRGEPGPRVEFLGRAYPVVDLRARFRLAPGGPAERSILVVEGERASAGLLVDLVVALMPVEAEAVLPLPAVFAGVEREWFAGLVPVGSRLVPVVRVDGLPLPGDRALAPARAAGV